MPAKIWSLQEVSSIIFSTEHRQVEIFKNLFPTLTSSEPTMLELGAAEGLYSIIFRDYFLKENKAHKNICLEVAPQKIPQLKEHLPNAIIFHGYVGDLDDKDGDIINLFADDMDNKQKILDAQRKYTLEEVCNAANVKKVDILHVDIQGGELGVVNEIKDKNMQNMFRYYFISTHGNHDYYTDLVNTNFSNKNIILNDPNPFNGSGYGDGLIIFENLNF